MRPPILHWTVHAIFIKKNKVLLLKRQNTWFEDWNRCLPAGKLESWEFFLDWIIREAYEEVGIRLDKSNLWEPIFVNMFREKKNKNVISCYSFIKDWSGEPENKEPNLCSEISWFPIDNLPENTVSYMKIFWDRIVLGEKYIEVLI